MLYPMHPLFTTPPIPSNDVCPIGSGAWSPVALSLLVLDVDRTLVPDEITPLAGDNLRAIVQALEAGVRVLLLSGTPYEAEVPVRIFESGVSDHFHKETITYKLESVRRRCTEPVQAALLERGHPEAIANLEVNTISGVEIINFLFDAESGTYLEHRDMREAAFFSPDRQLASARALAVAYLRIFGETIFHDRHHFNEAIAAIDRADRFADVRDRFEKTIAPHGKARFWLFDSEMVILDHENQLDSHHTHQAVEEAVDILTERGYDMSPGSHYFPRYGDAFIKITRCEKGLALADHVCRHGVNGLVVGLGDSRTDDFLWTPLPTPYLPIYLGPAGQVAERPGVMVAHLGGQDNLKDRHTGWIIQQLLAARADGETVFEPLLVERRQLNVALNRAPHRRLQDYEGYIFDIDGVLLRGGEVIPGARETLQRLQELGTPYVLLTNNSTRSRRDLAALMAQSNLPVAAEALVSSTYAAAQYLLQHAAKASVLVLGAPGLVAELELAGLRLVDDPEEADFLVTGADPELSADRLKMALSALREGARWLAVSLDRLHPTPEGYQAGGGSIAGALEAFIQRPPDVYVGKPDREIVDIALGRLQRTAGQVLIIGDTLTSDIAAGHNAGMDSCLVMSGATMAEKLAHSPIQPSRTLESVAELGRALGAEINTPEKKGVAAKKTVGDESSGEAVKADGSGKTRVFINASPEFIEGLENIDVAVMDQPEGVDCLITGPHPPLDKKRLDACLRALTGGASWIAVSDGALHAAMPTTGGFLRGALAYCTDREPDLIIDLFSGELKRTGAGQTSIRLDTLGNLIRESVCVREKLVHYTRHVRRVIDLLKAGDHPEVALIHHNDGDGISAGSILKIALERAGWRVNTVGVEKLYTQILEMILERFDMPILFTDLGAGAVPEMARLNEKRVPIIVVDHHHTPVRRDFPEEKVFNLSCERFGISGEEAVCGAGMAWAFAKALDDRNDDLAWLAVVGAVADRQTRSFGRLLAYNRVALHVAHERGDIDVQWFEGSRETYTLNGFGKATTVTGLADNLTQLGTVSFHGGGQEMAMAAIEKRHFGLREQTAFRTARRLKERLFEKLQQQTTRDRTETDHILLADSGALFENMGLKMIGLFLENGFQLRAAGNAPDKYLIGFQNVRSEIKGLGSVGEGWVKVSGRLPKALERAVREGRMPGFKVLFAEAARRMGLSLDACHDYAAALVMRHEQKKAFVALLEEVVQGRCPEEGAEAANPLIRRHETLAELERSGTDLLIIGGGINGAGAALDAASRGLRTALLEMNDFGSGTSMASSKMFHGGLRYLMDMDIGLVFEALREREIAQRLAPDMVRPQPFIFPIYDHTRADTLLGRAARLAKKTWESAAGVVKWAHALVTGGEQAGMVEMAGRLGMMRLSMTLYSTLAGLGHFRRRAGDGKRRWHEMLDREEILEREPALNGRGLAFGCQYWDGFMAPGDARVTLQVIKTAQRHGAACLNHCQVVQFLRDEKGRIRGVEALDRVTGVRHVIRAKKVINTTGPWGDRVSGLAGESGVPLRLTKGVHLMISRQRLPIRNAILMAGADGRVAWMIPWEDHVLVGTTDDDYQGDPAEVAAERADVDYLLEAVNRYLPDVRLTDADVISTTAGLRPLVAPDGESMAESSVSREDLIREGEGGMISVAGGKFTTYRAMAARLVDLAARDLRHTYGMTVKPSRTKSIKLKTDAPTDSYPDLAPEVLEYFLNFYGGEFTEIAQRLEREPALKEKIVPDLPHTWGEILHALEREQALTLSDIMRRRTTLFLKDADQGLGVAERVAEFMRRRFGETYRWRDLQLAAYRQEVTENRAWRGDAGRDQALCRVRRVA